MKKLILFIIIGMMISSCFLQKSGINITLINETNEVIHHVRVTTSDNQASTMVSELKSQGRVTLHLDMGTVIQTDGDYILFFRRSSQDEYENSFGYYTNGYPLENELIFTIQKDTVLFNNN